MTEPTFRAFCALDLSLDTAAQVITIIQDLKKSGKYPHIKWTKPENLHLTMRFLGNISDEQFANLVTCVNNKLYLISTFTLQLTELFIFPNKHNQVALALKPAPLTTLIQINQILEKCAVECDMKPEPRPFSPHLTLGKIKGKPIHELAPSKIPKLACEIKSVQVYKSEIMENGSTYTPLVCCLFQNMG
jgi:RNA 2',3'-cyclic 3'-phosphodiesterase